MGTFTNIKKSRTIMKFLPVLCLLLATNFIETSQHHINKIEDSKVCENPIHGTKIHWMCTCGVETRNNDGVMSEECKFEKELVIANQKRCASFHVKFADNYEMFFDDYNEEFVVDDHQSLLRKKGSFLINFVRQIFFFFILFQSLLLRKQ